MMAASQADRQPVSIPHVNPPIPLTASASIYFSDELHTVEFYTDST